MLTSGAESFEIARARASEPRIYHGLFSSHPGAECARDPGRQGCGQARAGPAGGWVDNRDEYLRRLDGMVYGSSRAQGIVRDNRFLPHRTWASRYTFPRLGSWSPALGSICSRRRITKDTDGPGFRRRRRASETRVRASSC